MELWLVRHAPAEESDPARWPDDDARPLTPDGAALVARLAAPLARRIGSPRRLATSPALRARATAELLQPALSPDSPVETWEELKPGARPGPALARLRILARRGGPFPVLVGHAPTLNEIVGLAVEGRPLEIVRIPRGGAVALDWPPPGRAGGARLVTLLEPEGLASDGP